MFSWIKPTDRIDGPDVKRGLRALLHEGACAQVMDALTGGPFLVAFVLLLDASNTVIGLLSAVSPIAQALQIPAVYLVDRTALRKVLVVLCTLIGRIFWLVIAVIPWLVAREQALPTLVVCLFVYFGLSAVSGCAFDPWLRDFVPEKIMGRYFGKRLAIATAVGALAAVVAGFGLETGKPYVDDPFVPYTLLFLVAGGIGLAGVYFITQMPEPRMKAQKSHDVVEALGQPLRDSNYRRLLVVVGAWFFAINLPGPFFVVYMIKRLELSMSVVVGLTVFSQIMSVLFFRVWGRAADSFSNKSVFSVSGYIFVFSTLLWPFLALPEPHLFTIPLLVVIYAATGISNAGFNLCAVNITLKLAPPGKATSFLAVSSVIHGLAAGTAPILGGLIADGLSEHQRSLLPQWTSAIAGYFLDFHASDVLRFNFLFVFGVIIGLYAMRRLRTVREEGEIGERAVIRRLGTEVRYAMGHLSDVVLRRLGTSSSLADSEKSVPSPAMD